MATMASTFAGVDHTQGTHVQAKTMAIVRVLSRSCATEPVLATTVETIFGVGPRNWARMKCSYAEWTYSLDIGSLDSGEPTLHATRELILNEMDHLLIKLACHSSSEGFSIREEETTCMRGFRQHDIAQPYWRLGKQPVGSDLRKFCVCLNELQLARSGIESVTLSRMVTNRNHCTSREHKKLNMKCTGKSSCEKKTGLCSLRPSTSRPWMVFPVEWPLSSRRELLVGAKIISMEVTCTVKLCSTRGVIFSSYSGPLKSSSNCEQPQNLESSDATTLTPPVEFQSSYSIGMMFLSYMCDILHSFSNEVARNSVDNRSIILVMWPRLLRFLSPASSEPDGMTSSCTVVNSQIFPELRHLYFELPGMGRCGIYMQLIDLALDALAHTKYSTEGFKVSFNSIVLVSMSGASRSATVTTLSMAASQGVVPTVALTTPHTNYSGLGQELRPLPWLSFDCSYQGMHLKHLGLLPQSIYVLAHFVDYLNFMRNSWRYLLSVLLKQCPSEKVDYWIPMVPKDTSVTSQQIVGLMDVRLKLQWLPISCKCQTVHVRSELLHVQWQFLSREAFQGSGCCAKQCSSEQYGHLLGQLICCFEHMPIEEPFGCLQSTQWQSWRPPDRATSDVKRLSKKCCSQTVVQEFYLQNFALVRKMKNNGSHSFNFSVDTATVHSSNACSFENILVRIWISQEPPVEQVQESTSLFTILTLDWLKLVACYKTCACSLDTQDVMKIKWLAQLIAKFIGRVHKRGLHHNAVENKKNKSIRSL